MLQASVFVQTMELNKGVKIACLEEIAFNQGFISKSDLMAKIEKYGYKNEYYNYVRTILNQSGETILA
jgi:glucose-1-phosphate thymidylyltransferase